MAGAKPTLDYFKLQGLGEPIRIVLALAGQEWTENENGIDYADMKAKAGTEEWAFGQGPRYSDDVVKNVCQSNTIIRYLGKKHKLYGDNLAEETTIDMLLDSFTDFNSKYVKLIYMDSCEDGAMKAFVDQHLMPGEAEKTRNGGAHMQFSENALQRNGGDFFVGKRLSVADTSMYYCVSRFIEREVFKKYFDFRKHYPLLSKHYDMVKGQAGVAKHIESPLHFEAMNGVALG